MASAIMREAAEELERKTNQIKRQRERAKAEEEEVMGGLAQLGVGFGAGFVDTRWGTPQEPANVKGIPTVALIGGGMLAASLFKGVPGRKYFGRAGFTLGAIAEYRYMLDHQSFAPEG